MKITNTWIGVYLDLDSMIQEIPRPKVTLTKAQQQRLQEIKNRPKKRWRNNE